MNQLKIATLFLFFVSILISGFYAFNFGFGCGLGMGHDFDCRVLIPVFLGLVIIYIISFLLLAVAYFTGNIKVQKIFFIISIILLVLIISDFVFFTNYKKIPLHIRMQYFEGQTVESCSSDDCLISIFKAQIWGDKNPSKELCNRISNIDKKNNCLLFYDALVNGNFNACLNITSPIGVSGTFYWPYDLDLEVWSARDDRDFCYRQLAFKENNVYVKKSPYIYISANKPYDTYDLATCVAETRLPAKNYCFYLTGRCGNIISAPIMQEDCKAYYKRYYPQYYSEE